MIVPKQNRLLVCILLLFFASFFGPPIGGFVFGFVYMFGTFLSVLADFLLFFEEATGRNHSLGQWDDIFEILSFPIITAFLGYIAGIIPAVLSGLFVAIHVFVSGRLSKRISLTYTFFVIIGCSIFLLNHEKPKDLEDAFMIFLIFTACALSSSYLLTKWFPGVLEQLGFRISRLGGDA